MFLSRSGMPEPIDNRRNRVSNHTRLSDLSFVSLVVLCGFVRLSDVNQRSGS